MNLYSDFDMAETFSRKLRLSHTFMNTYDHHCMITFLITTFKKHSNIAQLRPNPVYLPQTSLKSPWVKK